MFTSLEKKMKLSESKNGLEYKPEEVHLFFKSTSPFSQWHRCVFEETQIDESTELKICNQFSSSEQYMMYKKAMLFGDTKMANEIMLETRPSTIKKMGRKIKNFDQSAWDSAKEEIVYNGNLLKFSSPRLKRYILSTKNKVLIEASPYDRIWGAGLDKYDPRIYNPSMWRGSNLLGKCLMKVRHTLATD